jgi:RNA polymerase sigma-70 factor (ECF subfamily)
MTEPPETDRPESGPAPQAEPTASDERLLARFVAGDHSALGELAERYERAMVGLARGLLGEEQLAREAVQETWVRVIRFAAGYDGRASVKTWMYHILTNRCRDLSRSDRARRARELGRHPPEHEPAIQPAALLSRRVREAVSDLEEPGRETLILCFHRGLTHRQAADVLGVPMGTIKSRLHKAMQRLRERLGVIETAELKESPA